MKPIYDFIETETDRDEEFYFKLYYLLMEEFKK